MDDMHERENRRRINLVGPVILIGLGVVFLLNNLGILGWSVWEVIVRLWPVLLVAAGLELLLGRRSVWGAILALMLTIGLVVGSLWLLGSGLATPSAATEEISYALDEATWAEVILAPAVGGLRVQAGPEDSSRLVSGVIHPVSGESIARDFEVEGNTAFLALRSQGAMFNPTFGSGGETWHWDLSLTPDAPLALDVSIGAGKCRVDLQRLMVDDLIVSAGVGQTTVVLPSEGRFQAKIDGAIGNMLIVIPQGMEARIRFDTGLVNRNVSGEFVHQDEDGGIYTSPGYDTADHRVDLDVGLAIGSVTVRR